MRGESRAELLIRGQSAGFGIGDVNDLLGRYSISGPTDLKCEGGNIVSRMCINPECQNTSLICVDNSCQHCGPSKHKYCQMVFLKSLTEMLNKRANSHKDFIVDLFNSENAFIEELQQSRQPLAEKYYLGEMTEEHLQIVREIYEDRSVAGLKGKKTGELFAHLQKEEEAEESRIAELKKKYKADIYWAKQPMLGFKEIYY
jgi:hypothetical protein